MRTGERIAVCILGIALLAMTSCDRFGRKHKPCEPKQGIVETICSSAILQERLKAGKPVVIKCFAYWCPPCQAMAPLFESVATQFKDKALFIALDFDNDDTKPVVMKLFPKTPQIPAFFAFNKKGTLVGSLVGMCEEKDLAALAKKTLA